MKIVNNPDIIREMIADPQRREQGFRLLMRQYGKSLYWHIRRIVVGHDDAEDVLQDAFVRLWPLSERISSDQEAKALATTTVRNLAIDRYRTLQRMKTAENEPEDIADTAQDEESETEQRMAVVEEIMSRVLSPTQQTIFRMREFEQISYEQIAKQLNMQPAAVRMQLSRARKAIRDEYRHIKSKEKESDNG